MLIDSYNFGKMVISGREYTADLIIYPDGRIQDSWWRREGHRLALADIRELVEAAPEIIVVGTGAFGRMKPEEDLESLLGEETIELIARPTGEAVRIYRENSREKRVGACFHLTC